MTNKKIQQLRNQIDEYDIKILSLLKYKTMQFDELSKSFHIKPVLYNELKKLWTIISQNHSREEKNNQGLLLLKVILKRIHCGQSIRNISPNIHDYQREYSIINHITSNGGKKYTKVWYTLFKLSKLYGVQHET